MTFINNALAISPTVDISTLLNSPENPATNIKTVTLGGLLTGGGFNLIDFVFIIIGLIFFATLVMAGWDYMLSSGDPKKVAAATTRILNGVVGLIMVAVAFVIVRLITNFLGLGTLV